MNWPKPPAFAHRRRPQSPPTNECRRQLPPSGCRVITCSAGAWSWALAELCLQPDRLPSDPGELGHVAVLSAPKHGQSAGPSSVGFRPNTASQRLGMVAELPHSTVRLAIAGPLVLAALVLCERRLAGALVRPLPAWCLWAFGVLLLLMAGELPRRLLACDWATDRGDQRDSYSARAVAWLPLAAALLFAASVSLPGSSLAGLVGLWCCVLAASLTDLARLRRRSSTPPLLLPAARDEMPRTSLGQPTATRLRIDVPVDEAPDNRSEHEGFATDGPDADDAYLPPEVSQRLVRRQEPDGSELLTGVVRACFEPGQKTTYVHVAFCPPFPSLPLCDAEAIDGPDAEVKVNQVVGHGLRLEVRLEKVEHEIASVLVEFVARCQPQIGQQFATRGRPRRA